MKAGINRVREHNCLIYPLGVFKIYEGFHVSVAAKGRSCKFVIYGEGENPLLSIPFPIQDRLGHVWSMGISDADGSPLGELLGKHKSLVYCFEADGKEFTDPYGRAFVGHEAWGDIENGKKLLKSPLPIGEGIFDWEGDKPLLLPYENMILYRIHPRGFTRHPSSKVKNKGTFKGIMEKIPYLKDLGITSVELMPPMEFYEVIMPEQIEGAPFINTEPTGKVNYWGYTKTCYFAPKSSYASGEDKKPANEFKMLVKELHRNGMELIVEMYATKREDCSMVRDAARFWVREFHVDGLHLVGDADPSLLGDDPYLSRTKIFANSWGETEAGDGRYLAEYNDGFLMDMRRLLKGDEDQLNRLIYRSKRNPKGFGVINYMANTNGFTMMDMVSYDAKHNEANGEQSRDGSDYNYSWNCGQEGPTRKKKIADLRQKQLRNAFLLLLLSQGTPLILAGDEFGHSKKGNNNSYCQDNEISWLNWNLQKTNIRLYEFVRGAIVFRKNHPIFHMDREPMIMDYMACGHPDVSYHGVKAWCPEFENYRRQLGIMYCGDYGKRADGRPDDYFFVAYNFHWEPHEFALPNLPKKMRWHLALNTDDRIYNGIYQEGKEPLLEQQKQYIVPERTIVVFLGKEPDKEGPLVAIDRTV